MQAERARQRDAELELRYITAEKLESPLDPLLAALANFHSPADLSAKVAQGLDGRSMYRGLFSHDMAKEPWL